MHITYIAEYNLFDPDENSGTSYFMLKNMQQLANVHIDSLHLNWAQQLLPPLQELTFRCKKKWFYWSSGHVLASDLYLPRAYLIGDTFTSLLASRKADAILTAFSPLSAAYLETNIPIVYWTDATLAGLCSFYPLFRRLHHDTLWDGYFITRAALSNAKLLLFSSQWAARSAIELYGISKNKIRIVPFGANLIVNHTLNDVKDMIKKRDKNCIKLLFVGKNWYRKGGDLVLSAAKLIHDAGHNIELNIIGCKPDEFPLPDYIKCFNFLSKDKNADVNFIKQLYQESHFLFVPSRAEAYGVVFCEANAFGVPCITSQVGGIPDIVKDGINGMTFPLDADIKQYCDYIISIMSNYADYESLALSAFNEYQTRLNWQTACEQVKKYMAEL